VVPCQGGTVWWGGAVPGSYSMVRWCRAREVQYGEAVPCQGVTVHGEVVPCQGVTVWWGGAVPGSILLMIYLWGNRLWLPGGGAYITSRLIRREYGSTHFIMEPQIHKCTKQQ
jgi:hypothetical protein